MNVCQIEYVPIIVSPVSLAEVEDVVETVEGLRAWPLAWPFPTPWSPPPFPGTCDKQAFELEEELLVLELEVSMEELTVLITDAAEEELDRVSVGLSPMGGMGRAVCDLRPHMRSFFMLLSTE